MGTQDVAFAFWPYAVAAPPANVAAKAAAPALKRERNDRLSKDDRETCPFICSSLLDGNFRLRDGSILTYPLERPVRRADEQPINRREFNQIRTQPLVPSWNPAGYLYNVVDRVRINVET